MKTLSYTNILVLALVLSFGLSGCGGGSTSNDNNNGGNTPSVSTTVTGTFIDDPVKGLSYTCSSGSSGTTDIYGEYTCNTGDNVTFKLGNISLGTVAAQTTPITPYVIFPTDTTAAINLARVLQSVDTGAIIGVLDLNSTLVDLFATNTDFTNASFETEIETALGITLASPSEAQAIMNASIIEEGGTVPSNRNAAPVANAGADQNINTTSTVTLDGSGSSDANSDTLTYAWSITSKPNGSNAKLSYTTIVNPTFVANLDGAYILSLVVNDGSVNSVADTVIINALSQKALAFQKIKAYAMSDGNTPAPTLTDYTHANIQNVEQSILQVLNENIASSIASEVDTESELQAIVIVLRKPNVVPVANIPIMNIIKRSDWIDVRDMGAKGDGKHDDTQAIQSALDLLKTDNTKSGVYFPEGTFNITKTLTIGGNLYGKTIAGHGRKTIIKWASSTPNPMLISKGNAYSKYYGLTWDGNNIATIGIYHRSTTIYETQIIHKNEAFKNLTQSGIEVYGGSSSGDLTAAEVLVENCLFDNTVIGLNIGTVMYNAYDWIIDRCEIRNNDWGIKSLKGQFFLYNTHFQNNSEGDIWSENGSFIRRVTSENSKMFYKDILGSSSGQLSTFQDVHVADWTASDGIALNYGYRGSMLIFDSSFTNSNTNIYPIHLQGRTGTWTQHATLSNVKFNGNHLYDSSRNAQFVNIPDNGSQPIISSASRTFIDSTTLNETKIIEVTGNDTQSIQTAIDKAATSKDSIVYMPARYYVLNSAVNVHGSDYSIEGAGLSSRYNYNSGTTGGIYFKINNVQNVNISNMRLSLKNGEIGVFMNTDGTVFFDRMQTKDPSYYLDENLFVLKNLGTNSKITFGFNNGKIFVDNCSNAIIYAKIHLGNVQLSGKQGNGFTGFRWLSSRNITVEDNLNLVVGDFYTEQAENIFHFLGNDNSQEAQIIFGGCQRIHSWNRASEEYGIFDNYLGDIIFMQSNFDKADIGLTDQIILKQTKDSKNHLNLVLWGDGFTNFKNSRYNPPFSADISNGEKLIEQSTIVIDGSNKQYDIPNSENINPAKVIMQEAFTKLRYLGSLDGTVN